MYLSIKNKYFSADYKSKLFQICCYNSLITWLLLLTLTLVFKSMLLKIWLYFLVEDDMLIIILLLIMKEE